MHVTGSSVIDGYSFYEGTIDGHGVVDVRSGEKEYEGVLAADRAAAVGEYVNAEG